ncbi:hypothetical protein NQ314_001678 [Rhamnusium bicolor]|uniref:Transposase n=1 Tax=Rhamnusium bicolor TaxID=1586634 RepID=A0AAV8ZRQ3_9CUCU|nr:hypothetical protein NQ314_001678 [Rhamnusium bicolor]
MSAKIRYGRLPLLYGLLPLWTYKIKKENLKPLTEGLLRQARELNERRISLRETGRTLGYDESTIRKRLKAGSGVNSLGRFRAVFTAVQEKQIVDHCKALDLRFYELTLKSLRFLAYQYAQRNGITHPFNNETKLAGRDWTRKFMKRNQIEISCQQNLQHGFQTVPSKLPKHVAPTGKREVAKNVAAEQGKTVTVASSMSATGHYVPPFFIFARKRLNLLLIKDAPTGSALGVTDSGYMNSLRFVDYLEPFRKYTNPTAESPILLMLDNHISHTVIAHSPWTEFFFRPLKAYYDDLCDNWTTSNPGEVVTEYHIAGLFRQAYEKAVNGFKMTGIYPLDENIFTEEDFLSSSVTEQANETEEIDDVDRGDRDMHSNIVFEEDRPEGNNEAEAEEPIEEADNLSDRANVSSEPESPKPGCSREYKSQISECSKENAEQLSVTLPSDILPLPILTKKRKQTRKGLKSTLLTSTPNKEELENIEQENRRKIVFNHSQSYRTRA